MQEHTYMLRHWRENDKEDWKWSLKNIREDKMLFFMSEQGLITYLKQLSKKQQDADAIVNAMLEEP
jgi:hypothetical protein